MLVCHRVYIYCFVNVIHYDYWKKLEVTVQTRNSVFFLQTLVFFLMFLFWRVFMNICSHRPCHSYFFPASFLTLHLQTAEFPLLKAMVCRCKQNESGEQIGNLTLWPHMSIQRTTDRRSKREVVLRYIRQIQWLSQYIYRSRAKWFASDPVGVSLNACVCAKTNIANVWSDLETLERQV